MKHMLMVLIVLPLLMACEPGSLIGPVPTPVLTKEQKLMVGAGARYGEAFYTEREDCVQDANNWELAECFFPTGELEIITRPEWEELFPEAVFYLVELGLWRSGEALPAHQKQDGGTHVQIVAWQAGEAYPLGQFTRLLAQNEVPVTAENRERIARALALMSMPNHLNGEVRFLEWGPIPRSFDPHATHILEAWTEIWGCRAAWYFEFSDQDLLAVLVKRPKCYLDEYGAYVEDESFIEWGCEGDPTRIGPEQQSYDFRDLPADRQPGPAPVPTPAMP